MKINRTLFKSHILFFAYLVYIIQNICKSYRNSLFQMEGSKPNNLIKVCVVINNAVKKEKKCHVLHGNKRK